ncbi:hypothetical protein AQUCO_13300025v1 [Aquilegia coerulea]|uniref:SCP domain-containing protein n=1 Tax=Aquilegia coerulea TaxID=218851 RepID=A0A2G5C182_AQUCA|nr:hypothetical protein AQUCO_13300025v1 [Aquilegia coerulea]
MKLYTSFLCLVGFLAYQPRVSQGLGYRVPSQYQWPKPHNVVPLQAPHDTPEKWVRLHNLARSKVGVGPLKWNTTLANYAKNYSQQRSGDCELIHSQGPYGENIYWGQGEGVIDAAAAMKAWVDGEVVNYDYNSNSCEFGKQCGHYTQIVWKDTTQLGCGTAKCSDAENKVFITCNYYPPGNYIGERPY